MLKKVRRHKLTKVLVWVTIFTTLGTQLSPGAPPPRPREPIINWNKGLPPGWTQTTTPELRALIDARQATELRSHTGSPFPTLNTQPSTLNPDVRPLSAHEMSSIKGRGPYRNKYFSGVLPWQRQLRDVNLCNGNLFKSFTDIQVAPARGAGLVLQRTYNSNDDRIGPFGTGCLLFLLLFPPCHLLRRPEFSARLDKTGGPGFGCRADSGGGRTPGMLVSAETFRPRVHIRAAHRHIVQR